MVKDAHADECKREQIELGPDTGDLGGLTDRPGQENYEENTQNCEDAKKRNDVLANVHGRFPRELYDGGAYRSISFDC